jgi:hypothetical protein
MCASSFSSPTVVRQAPVPHSPWRSARPSKIESSQLLVCVRAWRARALSRSRPGYTRVAQPVSPAHSRLPDADVHGRERVPAGYTMADGTEFTGAPAADSITIADTYYGRWRFSQHTFSCSFTAPLSLSPLSLPLPLSGRASTPPPPSLSLTTHTLSRSLFPSLALSGWFLPAGDAKKNCSIVMQHYLAKAGLRTNRKSKMAHNLFL